MNYLGIAALLNSHQPAFSLAQPFYTSDEILNFEWQHIWQKNWLFAGNTAQIPRPGDYFIYNLQKDAIIIIRGNKGEVYAHYNTCAHRGSAICLEQKGNAAKLICPYHQWVYDKDGTLLNARMMPDDFCKEKFNLRSVHAAVVEGLIFICLTEDAPDFSLIKKSLAPYLFPYKINDAKVAAIKNYTLRANWKLAAENFRECYHCGGAHPEYCSAVIGANLREDRLTQFWEITGEQDGQLCENNFRGIETIGYRPSPYAPVEDQVINFVEWCVEPDINRDHGN